ncbi:CHASE3 domain-containing protein [Streptomyces sp. NPDC001380]|uniref:sensor histidine kinase n=1 Tax=Streptomyces sp. NPDC001380 TaxID=3364566 RepID=UPI0036821273
MSPAPSASRRTLTGRLTVQGWFNLVLALMGVLVVVAAVVGSQLLSRTADVSDHLQGEVLPSRTQAYRLQAALADQETGVRGYVISRDPRFLEPYTRGLAEAAEAGRLLRTMTAGSPAAAADLDRVEQAAVSWRRDFAEPLIDRTRAGERPGDDSALLDRSKRSFDQVRTAFTDQDRHLVRERDRARAELKRIRTMRDGVLGAMVGGFLVTCAALAVLLQMIVGRPLRALGADSRKVAAGQFGHRITEDGPADLRLLAADVEAMRDRIVEELESSQAKRETLARQAADLDAQAVELRRSNAELEQFAYVASHDLQEPLRKVASFCQLLEKRYGDKLDERGTQYIGFAVDGAKRMQVLINDLLTFSRVGRLNDARLPVELDRTLDKALANLAAAVEESGAVVERPDALPEITGDPMLLAMLWQNLVGNAVKFRDPSRPPVVRIEARPDEEEGWHFSVTDNGIGIPGQFAEKVFVIFQRLHGRDAYTGTGIGLALCKKIVEHHGGRIWLDTDRAEGASIHFTLPAVQAGTAEDGDAADPGSDAAASVPRPAAAAEAAPAAEATSRPATASSTETEAHAEAEAASTEGAPA